MPKPKAIMSANPFPSSASADGVDSAGFTALCSALRDNAATQQAHFEQLQARVAFKERLLADLRASLLSMTSTHVFGSTCQKTAHQDQEESLSSPKLVTVHPPLAVSNPTAGRQRPLEYKHVVGGGIRRGSVAADSLPLFSMQVDPVLVWSCPSSGSFTVALALTLSRQSPGPIHHVSLELHPAQDTPRHYHLSAKSILVPLLKPGQSTTLCAHGTLHGLLQPSSPSSLGIAVSIQHDDMDATDIRTTHRLPHVIPIPSPLALSRQLASLLSDPADLGLAIAFPLCATLHVTYPGLESTAHTILHWLDPNRSLSTLAHTRFANLSPGGLVALDMSAGVSVCIQLSGKCQGQAHQDALTGLAQLTQQPSKGTRTIQQEGGLVWTCEVSARNAQALAHFFSNRCGHGPEKDKDSYVEVEVEVVSVGGHASSSQSQSVGELADLVGEWVRKSNENEVSEQPRSRDWGQVDRMYELMQQVSM